MTRSAARDLEEKLRRHDDTEWTEASAGLGLLACRSASARQRLLALAGSDLPFWQERSLPGLGQLAAAHPAGVAALTRLLEHGEEKVREGAVRALGTAACAADEAWDALLRCAKSEDPALRLGAAQGLAQCAGDRAAAVKALEALCSDPKGPVRAAAANGAARAAQAEAHGGLSLLRRLCARAETDEHACQGMARGLAVFLRADPERAMTLASLLARSESESARWCAAAALSGLPEKARPGKGIAERLARDPSGLVRTRLAQSLGEAAPPWGLRILTRLSADADRFVAATAVDALGSFVNSAGVVDSLLGLAQSRQEHLRAAAAHGLARTAHRPAALKALKALAQDTRSAVRQAAASALAGAGSSDRADAGALLRELARDPEPRVRAAAARSMGEPEDEEALVRLARDQSPAVRLASAQGLRQLGQRDKAFGCLCDLLFDGHCREAAASALADALDADPERILAVARRLAASAEPGPALSSLRSACREPGIQQALDAWDLLLREADVPSAVRLARQRFEAGELAACRQFASFARLVESACLARDVEEVAQARRSVSKLSNSEFMAPEHESLWASLISAARAASLAERSRTAAEAAAHLASAAAALEGASAEADVEAALPRRLAGFICSAWRRAIDAAGADARQKADVRVALLSGVVIRRPVVKVALLVENAGQAAAQDVALEFAAGRGLTPGGADAEVGDLEPGAMAETSVLMRCSQGAPAGQVRVTARWRDSQKRRRGFSFAIAMRSARRRFAPVRNPYTPGKPLDQQSPMFFGRRDVFDLIRDSLRGAHQCNVVGLIGQRRTGKTSILKRLHLELGDSYLPVFVDVQGLLVDSLPLLYHRVASAASDALGSQDIVMDAPTPEDAQDAGFLERYLREAARRAGGRRLLIMLDEFDDLEPKVRSGLLPESLLSYLRHLMQHAPNVAFLLCGTHRIEELDPRYWSALSNLAVYQRLGPLDGASARDLAAKPLDAAGVAIEDMAVETLLRLCGGQPYLLQMAGHCVVSQVNELRRTAVTSEDVRQAMPRLVSSCGGHLQYLWKLTSPEERLALEALARRWPQDLWVRPGDISPNAEAGKGIEPAALQRVLGGLVEKDLVKPLGRPPVRYSLSMGLMALWACGGDMR